MPSGRSPLATIMARITQRFLRRCIRRRARRLIIRTHVLLHRQTLALRRIARGQVEFYNAFIELGRPEYRAVEEAELEFGAPRWIRRWMRRRRVDVGYSGIELVGLTAAASFAV